MVDQVRNERVRKGGAHVVPTRSRPRLITVNVAKTAATATKTHLIHFVSQHRSVCQGNRKIIRELKQERRRRLRKRHLKSELALLQSYRA